MKKSPIVKNLLIITSIFLILNINIIGSQANINDENTFIIQKNMDEEPYKIYFVIGISWYLYGGTWPVVHTINPVLMLKIGFSEFEILGHYSGESINFNGGDKFFGYSPIFNPINNYLIFEHGIGLGFVCGVWFNKL